MKYVRVLAALLLLAGCAAREIKVDCDGKLHPINPSTAPAGKATP